MKKIFTLFAALMMVLSMNAVPYLKGSFNGWGTDNSLASGSTEVSLTVGNYQFKVNDGSDWYGNNGQITSSITGWTFTTGEGNCTLVANIEGVYTFVWNASTKKLDVTYPQGEVVEIASTVALAGDLNNWSATANVLTNDSENLTATTIVNLAEGTHKFKMVEDSKWLGDNQTITRAANSQVFEKVDGSDCFITADVAGDYTFTWTYETNTLTVTYPALPTPEYTVTVADATVTTEQWSIDLAGTWEERTVTVKLWQDNVQGFGEYAANAETGYTCQLTNPYADLTPTTAGVYADNGDGTFTFTATMTDAEGGIYNISVTGAIPADEPEINWIEMPLEITNLTTEVMEVEGAKYLQLMGRDDMNDADVTLFLNNYADVDDDYAVYAEGSYMTFGGMELTVIEGTISQVSNTENGTIYQGKVRASVTDEEEGGTMYIEFSILMYSAPATPLVLTNAIVAINEDLGTLTFNVATDEADYFVELSGYTAPGVHEGPQICLLETPDAVAYTNYAETSVADGVITLTGEFTSFMGAKFALTISGTLPQGPSTGVENLNTTVAPVKAIVNGQLVIVKEGVKYNAQGAQL